jgi:cell division septum initiation protein DivIVA
MKTVQNEMKDHRDALASLADQIETLAAQLDELKSEMDDEVISADEMLHAMATPKKRITAQHFRFLAILNHYGEVPRKHVAKLLGLKESSVDQLANQIRKAHLGDLRSRKGVYTLHALGDDVSTNNNFTLV